MTGSICRAETSGIPAVTLRAGPPRRGAIMNAALVRAIDWLLAAQERARSRRALLSLDDRMLHDIGLDRARAEREGLRKFWDGS